ncbi:hypothetical protein P7C70_g5948, partial [Phenoliferia sp. Uapishka_3]
MPGPRWTSAQDERLKAFYAECRTTGKKGDFMYGVEAHMASARPGVSSGICQSRIDRLRKLSPNEQWNENAKTDWTKEQDRELLRLFYLHAKKRNGWKLVAQGCLAVRPGTVHSSCKARLRNLMKKAVANAPNKSAAQAIVAAEHSFSNNQTRKWADEDQDSWATALRSHLTLDAAYLSMPRDFQLRHNLRSSKHLADSRHLPFQRPAPTAKKPYTTPELAIVSDILLRLANNQISSKAEAHLEAIAALPSRTPTALWGLMFKQGGVARGKKVGGGNYEEGNAEADVTEEDLGDQEGLDVDTDFDVSSVLMDWAVEEHGEDVDNEKSLDIETNFDVSRVTLDWEVEEHGGWGTAPASAPGVTTGSAPESSEQAEKRKATHIDTWISSSSSESRECFSCGRSLVSSLLAFNAHVNECLDRKQQDSDDEVQIVETGSVGVGKKSSGVVVKKKKSDEKGAGSRGTKRVVGSKGKTGGKGKGRA